jgi:hypothetical protein
MELKILLQFFIKTIVDDIDDETPPQNWQKK